MIDVKDRYFSLNRTLLLAIGLWPYQSSKLARLQLGVVYIILITSIIFQLTPVLTSNYTVDSFITNLCVTSVFIGLIVEYNSFYVNKKTVKYLIEELQCICNNLKDAEIAILDKYGNIGKRYTVGLTMILILVIGASFMLVNQLRSDLAHSNLSVNISRQQSQLIITEYFIDQKKYLHFLVLHILAAIWLGSGAMVATGTMFIVYLQHTCGLFKIASFRIKHITEIHKDNILMDENLIQKNVICAVDIHRKAMMYANSLISNFEMSFFFLIVFGVLTLSFNILRSFQILSSAHYKIDAVPTFCPVSAGVAIIYMFLANFMGQQIINHNNDVYAAALISSVNGIIYRYESPWYLTPRSIRRLILFLLQRGNKTFGLHVGGLFIASLECFATLINASISYFTVMYSAR